MSYQIEFGTKITINVKNCNFEHLTAKFLFALKDLFQQFITAVLLHYFEEYYKNGKLKELLNIDNYRRKSTNARTRFKTHIPIVGVAMNIILNYQTVERNLRQPILKNV